MKVGDFTHGGIYAGTIDNHHIICSTIEYELPIEVDWHQANNYCKAIGMELPTKEELKLLYDLYRLAPKYFPKRQYPWYWSSTESSSTDAWVQYFFSGRPLAGSKATETPVRPIKRVKIDQCH